MRARRLVLGWTLSCCVVAHQPEALAQPHVEASASRSRLRVGESLELTYRYRTRQRGKLHVHVELDQNFTLLGKHADAAEETASTTLQLLALRGGTFQLSASAQWVDQQGRVVELSAPDVQLVVRSVLSSDAAVRVKPPTAAKDVWVIRRGLIGGLVAGCLLLLLLFGGFLLRRRYREKPRTLKPQLTPHQEASATLHVLGSELPLQSDADVHADWADRLSDVMRRYVGKRLSIPALELTTEELMRAVPQDAFGRANSAKLWDVLQRADTVKFAKSMFSGEEQLLIETAKDWVDDFEHSLGAPSPSSAQRSSRR